jgi:hypothetical protein
MKPFLVVLFTMMCCALIGSASLSAQCTGQDVPDCTCQTQRARTLDICIAGMTYTVQIFTCEQVPNPNLISDPCSYPYSCAGLRQNRISWVKSICVPIGFPSVGPEVIYNAIICVTDLCVNDYLGVSGSFPNCDRGTNACTTGFGVYSHTIAFPKCVQWNGPCLEMCDNDCDQHCYVQRRYCIDNGNCSTCDVSICEDPDAEACPGNCIEVDCEDLAFDACCN